MWRCHLTFLLITFPASVFGQQSGAAASDYTHVTDWPDLPAGWNFGEVAGVATNAQEHVFVFHRGPHPIMEFEAGGKFVRSWGDGMISWSPGPNNPTYALIPARPACDSCGAHSVRVDPEGNIWIVDVGGHVVVKMNPRGRVILQLGRKGVPGTGHGNFYLPTDVAFAPNGDFYITDGYGNSRVVKFSRDGRYLFEWGTKGSGPGEFLLPHAVVLDQEGRVYVADRENRRIEIFEPNGKFLREWTNIGGFSGLAMTKDQRIWAAGGDRVVLLNLDGQVLRSLPPGNLPGQVSAAHGIAVGGDGAIYVAELNWRVQKFVKK
jgi:DNA-binding beta-propeller fold protein YncE